VSKKCSTINNGNDSTKANHKLVDEHHTTDKSNMNQVLPSPLPATIPHYNVPSRRKKRKKPPMKNISQPFSSCSLV